MSNNNYESAIKNSAITANLTGPVNKPRPEPLILKLFQLGFSVAGRLSSVLAGRIAYKLWFTPTRFKTPASERKALDSSLSEILHIDGHDIAMLIAHHRNIVEPIHVTDTLIIWLGFC